MTRCPLCGAEGSGAFCAVCGSPLARDAAGDDTVIRHVPAPELTLPSGALPPEPSTVAFSAVRPENGAPEPPRTRARSILPGIGMGVLAGIAVLVAGSLVFGALTRPSATPAITSPVPGTATAGPTAPSASGPSVGETTVPVPAGPALGAWSATCDDADADAASLVANLTGQPQFAVPAPSTVAGFADAALVAAKPLRGCPVAHSLRVRERVAFASDAAATSIVQAKVDAVLRTVVLTLGGDRVGRYAFGSVKLDEAKLVYFAVLGQPDKVESTGCDLSGQRWTDLVWGGLRVSFDANAAGQPLYAWTLRTDQQHPQNLELKDSWPLSATLAELQTRAPSVTADDLFGNGVAPYVASPEVGLFYVWDGPTTSKSDSVAGGHLRTCE